MKYKKGDKVVVEISCFDDNTDDRPYQIGECGWIDESDILGKLEDYTKPKKINYRRNEK